MTKNALLMTVLGVAIFASANLQAAVVYDNGSPNHNSGNDATQWVQAEDFVLGGAATITGAGVYVADFNTGSADMSSWDGTIDYFIFADDGANNPGALLTSGSGSSVSLTDTGNAWLGGGAGNTHLLTFNLASGFAAAASTQYWFGIHLSTNFDRDDVYWVTQNGNGTNTQHESDGGTFNNWFDNNNEHAFFLESAETIPEPGSLALFGIGAVIAGVGAARRRK